MEREVTKYEVVVISGGGTNGILSLGALHREFEQGRYDPSVVTTYCGTSAGSIICLLMVCGYTPQALFNEIHRMDNFFGTPDSMGGLMEIFVHMGVMKTDGLRKKVSDLVIAKLGFIPTLSELQILTSKTFVAVATNVSSGCSVYYSHKTQPTMSCVDAVILSSNIPFVFRRSSHEGEYIADGGVTNNFPLDYVDDGKRAVLGISTSGLDTSSSIEGFFNYLYKLSSLCAMANTETCCKVAGDNVRLVSISRPSSPIFSLLGQDERMNMFVAGYNAAKKIITDTEYINVHISSSSSEEDSWLDEWGTKF